MADPWQRKNQGGYRNLGVVAAGRSDEDADALATRFIEFVGTLHIGNLERDRNHDKLNTVCIRSRDGTLKSISSTQTTEINRCFKGTQITHNSRGVEFWVPYDSGKGGLDDDPVPFQGLSLKDAITESGVLMFLGVSIYVLCIHALNL